MSKHTGRGSLLILQLPLSSAVLGVKTATKEKVNNCVVCQYVISDYILEVNHIIIARSFLWLSNNG